MSWSSDLSIDSLEKRVVEIVGERHAKRGDDSSMPISATRDWTGRFRGAPGVLAFPGSTDECVDLVSLCAGYGVPVVTQGGGTGLAGGSSAVSGGLLLNLNRMTDLELLDPTGQILRAGAGTTLERVQALADTEDRFFPVDIASRSAATVGGMAATNAGGLLAHRWGHMRTHVVGFEAVTGDGSLIESSGALKKDNTGYDFGQLMIGSEGTLGVITQLDLRLKRKLAYQAVALIGQRDLREAWYTVDEIVRAVPSLNTIELMFKEGIDLVCRSHELTHPFGGDVEVVLLISLSGSETEIDGALQFMLATCENAPTKVALDPPTRQRLWNYRELHSEAVSRVGLPHKLDVCVPMARFVEFVSTLRDRIGKRRDVDLLVVFGHVADGSVHVNVVGPAPDDYAVDLEIASLVLAANGSISAEHGIGRAKVSLVDPFRSREEWDLMKQIKKAFDPSGIMNPGVLFLV